MKKQATYPQRLSFIERLAKKVITRVVSDGIPLDNAVKEATSFAQLNTQQIFHLCSVLEDWGQIFNGDSKNYYHTNGDMGKAFPNSQNGYVVYAGANTKQASDEKLQRVFKTVTALKKQGFSDQDILNINGELSEVLAVINEFNTDYKTLVSEYQNAQKAPAPEQAPQKGFGQKVKDWAGNLIPQPAMPALASAKTDGGWTVTAQVAPGEEVPEAEAVDKLKAPAGELEVPEEEPALGGGEIEEEPAMGGDLEVDEDMGGGEVSAPIKPAPSELLTKIESAPKWDVKNVLSMQMAEAYYKNVQKDLEAVTGNPNIDWSSAMDSVAKYEKVRARIEEALAKIGEAQKGAEKIEKKEGELEQKYENKSDVPTDQLISGEEVEEEPVAPAAPKEEPNLEVPEF